MVKQFKAYGSAAMGSSSNMNSCARAARILLIRKREALDIINLINLIILKRTAGVTKSS